MASKLEPDKIPAPARAINAFWREAGPTRWFRRDPDFDEIIRARFLDTCEAALAGQYDTWANEAEGALALLILIDQFRRNLFRGKAHAFAGDAKAREITRAAIARGLDQRVEPHMRQFFYTPLMHGEDLADQDHSVALYATMTKQAPEDALLQSALHHARQHRDIIARFGRFPHRNPALGRKMLPEEQAYLDEGGFSA